MKNLYLKAMILIVVAAMSVTAGASEPSGYYDSAIGKNQETLLSALYNVVNQHTVWKYSDIYEAFATTDVNSQGIVYDLYSNAQHGVEDLHGCGGVEKKEKGMGGCLDREHSFPKSWFLDDSGVKTVPGTDIFHLYPADAFVNSQRNNDPYGECLSGTRLSNGSIIAKGKRGTSTFPGFTGVVFEPDDEYKGDLARGYFYMAACYYSETETWVSAMVGGTKYPFFSDWALNLLLKWHRQDPVSQKELDRQELVYGLQGNRNPFIDHPELAEYIWGNRKDAANGWPGTAGPTIVTPADGTTIYAGRVGVGKSGTVTVNLLSSELTSKVAITSSSSAFKFNKSSVTAATANAGTTLTLTFSPTAVGEASATATFKSGDAISTVTLTGTGYDATLPYIYLSETDIVLTSTPGVSSMATMLDVTTENITTPVTVRLGGEFEASLDGNTWSQTLTLPAAGKSIYVRGAKIDRKGIYRGTLVAEATAGTATVSESAQMMLTVSEEGDEFIFTEVTNVNQLRDGERIIIVNNTSDKAFGALKSSHGVPEDVTLEGNNITIDPESGVTVFTVGLVNGGYTLYNGAYLEYGGTGTSLAYNTESNHTWSIAIGTDGTATVKPSTASTRALRYRGDTQTPQFAAYATSTSQATPVKIYRNAPYSTEVIGFSNLGDIELTAQAGSPSAPEEVTIYTDGITEDILVEVTDEFELSRDRTNWSASITIDAGGENFYVRAKAITAPGTYVGTISANNSQNGASKTVKVTVEGGAVESITETWEGLTAYGKYANTSIVGTAFTWNVDNAGVWKDTARSIDEYSVRLGSNSDSYIEMAEDFADGATAFSFYTMKWNDKEADATLAVEYSTDGGTTWKSLATVEVTNYDALQQHAFTMNVTGNVRFRFRQTVGARVNIDDITITSAAQRLKGDINDDGSVDGNDVSIMLEMVLAGGVTDEQMAVADINDDGSVDGNDVSILLEIVLSGDGGSAAPRKLSSWDIYPAAEGGITVEAEDGAVATVYSLRAVKLTEATVVDGKAHINMPRGIYIVALDDERAEKIIVK